VRVYLTVTAFMHVHNLISLLESQAIRTPVAQALTLHFLFNVSQICKVKLSTIFQRRFLCRKCGLCTCSKCKIELDKGGTGQQIVKKTGTRVEQVVKLSLAVKLSLTIALCSLRVLLACVLDSALFIL
jgi:hypothetical protein